MKRLVAGTMVGPVGVSCAGPGGRAHLVEACSFGMAARMRFHVLAFGVLACTRICRVWCTGHATVARRGAFWLLVMRLCPRDRRLGPALAEPGCRDFK
eukprot:3900967-Prymnesium_polylepis.1